MLLKLVALETPSEALTLALLLFGVATTTIGANNQIIQGPGFITTGTPATTDLVLTNKASGAGVLALYANIGTAAAGTAPAGLTLSSSTTSSISIGNTVSGTSTVRAQ